MRCKYSFDIEGCLNPTSKVAFQINDYRFEFEHELDTEYIRKVFLSFQINATEIPTIKKSDKEGVNSQINLVSPRLSEVTEIMRSIESMWSLWGLESIEIESPTLTFIAETEHEKKLITINNVKVGNGDFDFSRLPKIPLDLFIKPVITSIKEKNHDLRLSFFRRGMLDVKQGEYIEAFYDFYLMLESTYGRGKSQNRAIEKLFYESEELQNSFSETILRPDYAHSLPKDIQGKFQKEYRGISYRELIKKFVKLRGFLSHHNVKRNENWNPTKQKDYRLEATMLADICCNVGMSLCWDKMENSGSGALYKKLVDNINSGKAPKIDIS